MRVADTSAWIEWLMQSPTGVALEEYFPTRDRQLVPTIVQFELAVWAARELNEDDADSILADTLTCTVAPLDTAIATRAAHIRQQHKLSTADAIIYATTLAFDADLLTCDAHFVGLPQVVYMPKVAA